MPKTCTSCGTTYPDTMVFCPTDGTSLRSDEAEGDLVGTVIADRYLVSKLLGEGGMGKVYLASHVRLPQKAAIKVLHHDMVKDAGAVARFNREAANAARIEHDRVARVFDFGETSDGLVYLAMEFVPGRTLRELLNDTPRLPAVRAANIVYQVAEGLDAAHRLSIVHRDLKPDNILVVTDESGGDRCKVVDFGIAKVTNSTETQLTQAGMLVGTPEFMSPEQVLGEQLDGRSDVYALALVAYEMFTGALPFEGNTPERKLTARLIQDPRPLAVVAPDVEWPAALQQAFDHALEREPDARTASALDFADAVVSAIEGWSGVPVLRSRTPLSTTAITMAGSGSTAAMGRPTPSSNSAAPGATVAGASASAKTAAGVVTGGAVGSASVSSGTPARSAPSGTRPPVAAIALVVVLVAAVGGYFAMSNGTSEEKAATPANEAQEPATKRVVTSYATADSGVGTKATAPAGPPSAPASVSASIPTSPPPAASGVATRPVPDAVPRTAVAAVAPPSPRAASEAEFSVARRALDDLRYGLSNAPDGEDAAVATRLMPRVSALLPRLGSATDSAWAYLALVTAHGMMERPDRACEPFRMASRLATTAEQRQTIERFRSVLTCAP